MNFKMLLLILYYLTLTTKLPGRHFCVPLIDEEYRSQEAQADCQGTQNCEVAK